MHDGSLATLEEVVEFYNRGAGHNPSLDSALGPLGLSKEDMRDLVAFLRALSDSAPKGKSHD
jgi:cytochrome c peroxidase